MILVPGVTLEVPEQEEPELLPEDEEDRLFVVMRPLFCEELHL